MFAGLAGVIAACVPATDPAGKSDDARIDGSTNDAGTADLPPLTPDAAAVVRIEQMTGIWETKGGDTTIRLVISSTHVDLQSSCIRGRWSYRLDNGKLVTSSVPVISCQRGLFEAERAAFDTISRATRALHCGGRGLIIETVDSRLVLFEA